MVAVTRVNPINRFVEFSNEETEQAISERFEKQVCKYPGQIAVQTSRVQLTYDELNELANRIARHLLQQFPDDNPIAILMEHDAPAVVAIFGALKAAKIFIPLDPALPDARIKQILKDSGVHLIVTNDQRMATALDLIEGSTSIFNIDRCDAALNSDNLDLKISPDSIGYILYTSGSTGQPKGVIRTHRNDLHNIRHHTNSLCFSKDDRYTLLGSFSTGQGIQDIFDALLNGGTLLPRNLKSEGFNGLAEWLMKERITVYHSAATFFRHFVRELSGQEKLPDLRVVRLGSEPMSWKDVESFKKRFSDQAILSIEFSCSEANTITQFLVNQQTEVNLTVPVGFPIQDKEILILDERGDKLGPGEIGEIAVRSRYLTPGYWNRPDLTQLAFIPDRESLKGRIYRTGDLGRKSADGCLEHLGRKDTQVKIRGYRVECYEIELPLLQIPGVDQVFVTHRQDAQGESCLVAYVVREKEARLTVSELRASLNARLPGYMVPRDFVLLETLPLTPTGKVDRHALPELRAERPPLDVPFVAPREPIEESVAKHWSGLLGFGNIGVHDSLFDLGGNSLSAMQTVAWIMRTFDVNMSLERFYESPTIASLSSRIAASLLNTVASKGLGISQEKRNRRPPLSFAQERLWFMEQWEPGKATYNLSLAYRLKGNINGCAMEESLNAVVERHEVLRTSFANQDDRPWQIIAPVVQMALATVDLGALPEAEINETSMRLAQEDARRPFNLAQAPLLRVLLVRLQNDEHLLIFTVHQIVCDGWSMRILLAEFWQSYQAISQNRPRSRPNLAVQYADFAVWQRQLLSEEWLDSQLSYWKETLSGAPPVLNLPTDKPRPPLQSFRGSRKTIELSESLTAALNRLSHQEGTTLFVTLMAAFNTLLYRYTGQEDLVVGFPIADRSWGEATGSIGLFVNTLIARADLSGQPTFRELLSRVRQICLGAYAHQDLPFEKLVQELRLNRDLSRNPLFQVMFTFQNMPLAYPEVAELCSAPISIDNGTSKVDLTLSLAERNNQLIGFFEYCADLFDGTTIERMADHFRTLLESIVADCDQSIAQLPFLTELESRQLLTEWNDTKAEYGHGSCIHELFEFQVDRTPDAIALEYEDKNLTFRELNNRANQLAHYLRGLEGSAKSLVGICLERSVDMVVGLLGILKAGAAYLALDPAYPSERLRFMLADSQVSVLLTVGKVIEANGSRPVLGEFEAMDDGNPRLKAIRLDRDAAIIEQQSSNNLKTQIDPDDLAYVIYTSGSTGTPKAVAGRHRGAVNRCAWMWKAYPFEANEKCCVKTSLSFVDSVWEIFGPLLQGIPLLLIADDILKDPQSLVGRLRDSHVTRIGLVPSFLKTLLDMFPDLQDYLPELKLWTCSGECLAKDVVERFQKSMPAGTLLNLYGSSEVSADATWYEVQTVIPEHSIPIGRPIDNTQTYIVDASLQPVPIGVPGELCIGGDGLAGGYLNRPELTAEKFIANPFSSDPTSRLYRTGDFARYLADGNIEFLGRLDNQVKIRGYRIELAEVESVLRRHSAVKDCLVVASERESSSEKELVGYLVPGEASRLSVAKLRSFLREQLPDYMIPSRFVFLDALPVTPSGKIDRNALPAFDGARPQLDQGFVEPRTEIEQLVAQVWREVLKLDKIGVYDNFFDLGGHSLLATRVVARLRGNFHVDLALRKLFELPTIAALAQHIETLRRRGAGAVITAITPVPRDQPLPLSFSQRRLWFLQKVDANLSAYNIPAAFRVKGDLDSTALERALNDVIARHEVLRSSIKEVDGRPRQESLPDLWVPLATIDLSNIPDEQAEAEANRLFNTDARQLYDLTNGPLLRATLVKLAADDHVLILNFHHIIADGSSLAIFYRELAVLYDAARGGKPASLPQLAVQYADFAAWQQQWLESASFDTQLAYWQRQLKDLPEPCSLPTDFDRPLLASHHGSRLSLGLSDQLTGALKGLCRQQSVTMFMTLFATFNVLLSRLTGREDIVIGSTIAGRNYPETEGLIGFFINALPLRTDLSGNPSFLALLKRVRELCLDGYTHQDLPLEKIVEEIKPRREPGRNPIFDILFNVADVSERVLALAGCDVTKLGQANPQAKFDLVLQAPEIDGKIELATVYNRALFNDSRMTLMLRQWAALLDQITSNSELPISQLSLVTDHSRALFPDPTQALDDTWVGAIHECLAEQARRSPEKLAVVDENQRWTYAEMNQCASRLAHALIDWGVRPKDVIAIYAERNSALVLALFGILKAGAAFVILDPAYPAARTVDYLRIARPKGWLQFGASGELSDELSSGLDDLPLRCRMHVPQSKAEISQALSVFADADPATIVTANDPAYIAFTSGSTGEPKGVVCRHGPMTHFLPWQNDAFGLTDNDRFAMLSGLAYSHLHRDVFTAIYLGATIYIPNPSEARAPQQLANWLEQNRITVLHLTPALGQLLLTSGHARLTSVRRVFFGGDVLTHGEVARIRWLMPNAKIGSFYGATETQRAVGYYEISVEQPGDLREVNRAVPLGRGIKGVQLLVLNRGGQLAGVSELGELFVRSPHLAEGYIGDEDRTEQMFIVNPFTNDPNDRLYRTGELGRYLPDGNVEWAGRNDRRVNIRGFRVELAEIEATLKQHPAVKNAAVVLREVELPNSETPKSEGSDNRKSTIENPKSDRRLVAYVAAEAESQSLADLLQSYLTTRLPHYMVPADYVIRQSLPLGPNGKVDYRALPRAQFSSGIGASTAPRNEVENRLCEIFAELLGRSEVGIDENFFRIGGHSLLAARAAARIGDSFGVSLALSTFLETPTVMGLAKEVASLLATGQTSTESDQEQREEFDL